MRRLSSDLAEPLRNIDESRGPHRDRHEHEDCDLDAPQDTDDLIMKQHLDSDVDLTMPPSEDEALDHDGPVYPPPPRIAARFYRPSQARRRASAASSRRNSMSSAHSRCSSSLQSPVSGDQSKHVAQHLRRASFLEDRRARLADRAAHAEKVRLRAAVAKAATRDNTLSEERALAAQQARERNLAEIVANCAEEVKKAKLIAESVKEKRDQGIAKMRLQMEERMAEAERRREELRKQNTKNRLRGQSQSQTSSRSRSRSDPQNDSHDDDAAEPAATAGGRGSSGPGKPPMRPDDAASKISGWWLCHSRRRAMQDFNNLGLSVDGIRDSSFDRVTDLLSQEKVLAATARLLRTCGLQEGTPGSVDDMMAVRTFLSAFLILGHPNEVLANKTDNSPGQQSQDADQGAAHRLPAADLENPQLQDLIGKAKDLLITFENILVRLTPANRYTVPPAIKKTLPEAYAVFHNAFIAWKSRDSNAMIEVMLMQFVELDAIFQTVKHSTDDAAAQLYRQSIQDNQLMLIVRIKKLAGQEKGKKLIFDAVTEARKSRKTKKKTGDTKPRVTETTPSEASVAASSLVSPEPSSHGLTTPPATPSAGPEQDRSTAGASKTGLNGLLPDNRTVVHELAINKEYQIPSEEYQEQQAALSRPLFERMRSNAGGSSPLEEFLFFMAISRDIKDKLQKLLRPGNSMYNLIDEMLDLDMAQQQFSLGSFSYEKFFGAMASILPKLCAPVRDEEVNDLIHNKLADGNLIDRVEALNSFIDVMLCDYINYMLQVAAPGLVEAAPQYESKRFAEDFQSGRVGLSVAEAAWRSARSKVLAEVQRRDPEGINHPRSRPGPDRFYAQMLVDVFTAPTPTDQAQVPEMFHLDHSRIVEVSTTVQRIITVGAVLLQCKNLLKRDVRSPWRLEAARVMAVLQEGYDSTEATVNGTMAALEAGRSMPAATKTHLRALVTKVLAASQEMSLRGTEPREPVLRLLLSRLRGNILARLAPGTASDKVRAANAAGERLATLGLSEFVDRVREMSDLLDKVGTVDRQAHGQWWDAIATRVEQDEGTASSATPAATP